MTMNFKYNGQDLINDYKKTGKYHIIIKEIRDLRRDCKNTNKGKMQLKDLDNAWDGLSRFQKINKGKRFKTYVRSGYISGVSIVKDKKNQPIVYNIK